MRTDRWAVLAVLVLIAGPVLTTGNEEPLTAADIVRFLEAGLGERTILFELGERGFGEVLDADREAAVRTAGGTETLVVAIRRAAPSPPSSPAPAPAPAPSAPRAGRAHPRSAPTFSSTARSVRVPVSVLDSKGQPVLGLRGEDFQISEDGRRQDIRFFSGERKPLRIALALDISLSMTERMSDVSDALQHFVDLLEPADEILVITFAAGVHVSGDFSSDREELERALSRLNPAGGTALYDAATEAIRRVSPGAAESKAVVLVTDGVDNSSQATFQDLRELARRSEVPIFSIGIGGGSSPRRLLQPVIGIGGRGPDRGRWPGGGGGGRRWPPVGGRGWPGGGTDGMGGGVPPDSTPRIWHEREFDARPLLELANDTGGRAEILKDLQRGPTHRSRLKAAVESIAMTLRHRYLLGYDEPETGKRGWRKIRVEVERPSSRVHARKGYYTES